MKNIPLNERIIFALDFADPALAEDCVRKLDLLKIWNVKVNDCCFDGGYRLAKPLQWKPEHIKKFRKMCRKHNQMIIHKLDPEVEKFG